MEGETLSGSGPNSIPQQSPQSQVHHVLPLERIQEFHSWRRKIKPLFVLLDKEPQTELEILVYREEGEEEMKKFLMEDPNFGDKCHVLHEELRHEFLDKKKEAESIWNDIQRQWKGMKDHEDYQLHYSIADAGILRLVQELKDQLHKREDDMKRQIPKLIFQMRKEIADVWEQCNIVEEERNEFEEFLSEDYDTQLLEVHREELIKWQMYHKNHELFDKIQPREEMWRTLRDLVAKAEDPHHRVSPTRRSLTRTSSNYGSYGSRSRRESERQFTELSQRLDNIPIRPPMPNPPAPIPMMNSGYQPYNPNPMDNSGSFVGAPPVAATPPPPPVASYRAPTPVSIYNPIEHPVTTNIASNVADQVKDGPPVGRIPLGSSLPQPPVSNVARGWNDPPMLTNTVAGAAKAKKVFRHAAPPPSALMGFSPAAPTGPYGGGGMSSVPAYSQQQQMGYGGGVGLSGMPAPGYQQQQPQQNPYGYGTGNAAPLPSASGYPQQQPQQVSYGYGPGAAALSSLPPASPYTSQQQPQAPYLGAPSVPSYPQQQQSSGYGGSISQQQPPFVNGANANSYQYQQQQPLPPNAPPSYNGGLGTGSGVPFGSYTSTSETMPPPSTRSSITNPPPEGQVHGITSMPPPTSAINYGEAAGEALISPDKPGESDGGSSLISANPPPASLPSVPPTPVDSSANANQTVISSSTTTVSSTYSPPLTSSGGMPAAASAMGTGVSNISQNFAPPPPSSSFKAPSSTMPGGMGVLNPSSIPALPVSSPAPVGNNPASLGANAYPPPPLSSFKAPGGVNLPGSVPSASSFPPPPLSGSFRSSTNTASAPDGLANESVTSSAFAQPPTLSSSLRSSPAGANVPPPTGSSAFLPPPPSSSFRSTASPASGTGSAPGSSAFPPPPSSSFRSSPAGGMVGPPPSSSSFRSMNPPPSGAGNPPPSNVGGFPAPPVQSIKLN